MGKLVPQLFSNFRNETPKRAIVRWFLRFFVCFFIISILVLVPLTMYCRDVFAELEIKKGTQQMGFGISQIENTVNAIGSAGQALHDDPRFIPVHYIEPDYTSITVSVRAQMRDYLNALFFPLDLVTDSALMFSQNMVITPSNILFNEKPGYYPVLFKVGDLSYAEWEELLQNNKAGFLPVQRITSGGKSYDAIIYSMPWTDEAYLYACMSITDVKKALIASSDLDSYYLTITDTKGNLIYTDLDESLADYHSVTENTSVGNLSITVHIPYNALTGRMKPLYTFLGIYLTVCTLIMMVTACFLSHFSSTPILRIIDGIEPEKTMVESKKEVQAKRQLHYGFQYIQNRINTYETNLTEYRNTIDTQKKVLQARFFEKALQGSLSTGDDYELFFSYFPDFPDSYCLVTIGILENPAENGNIYQNVLSMLQIYLQNAFSGVYLQQLNASEILLVMDSEVFDDQVETINYLLNNVNLQEPCYHAWGIASKFYDHPKYIPVAYWSIQDVYSKISVESLSELCTISEHVDTKKAVFQMADAQTIYTVITCGNRNAALTKLENYADRLKTRNRSIFEMFRAILLNIKQEYAAELMDLEVPSYRSGLDMYEALKTTVVSFCDVLQKNRDTTQVDPFAQEVKAYIDLHFTEDGLCHDTLAEHFNCSSSKIRKAFSQEMEISISAYIEKKRMELANELLIKGEDTVVEIARKCGFTSHNTFHKAYRRVFGHTPRSMK